MSTLAEIESATASLSLPELQDLERTVHERYRVLGDGLIYDDAHGCVTDEDLIAEADAAFLAYETAEASERHA